MATQIMDGLIKELLRPGEGPQVQRGRHLTVHCTGYLQDSGKKFWSTKDPGQEPFSFQVGVGGVIKGWDEGCLTMRVGEVARLTCAGHMAYGAGGFPAWGIGPNATLIFEIEVLNMK